MSSSNTCWSQRCHALTHISRRTQRVGECNAKLDAINSEAQARINESAKTFARYTALLVDAKRDLHSIFRRIRFAEFLGTQTLTLAQDTEGEDSKTVST